MFIRVTQVDNISKIPCNIAPMSEGPAFPDVKGLVIKWGNESQWPTNYPLYYGECDDDADVTISGVIKTLTKDEYMYLWEQDQNASVQRALDGFAAAKGYNGIVSLCTYATSANEQYKAEAQYGIDKRDATWAALYSIIDDVKSGARPIFMGYSAIVNELPALSWQD